MLINLSNHPFGTWNDEQKFAAEAVFDEVRDLPFPAVSPEWETGKVMALAREYVTTCRRMIEGPKDAVHIMGELTFLYAFVADARDLRCIASTSERRVIDLPGGDRKVSFQFVRFRDYKLQEPK